MMDGPWVVAVVAGGALVVLLCAPRTHADPSDTTSAFGRWKQAMSLSTGYGWGHEFFGSERDALDVQSIPVLPRWSMGVTDVLGTGTFYRGALDVAVEGLFLVNRQPREGSAAGGALGLRYNFLRRARLVPYLGAGAGMLALDFDLQTQRDGFNFALFAETGVSAFITDRFAITGGYRFQHISNANTRAPNLGVDTSFGVIGLTMFLR
jgi:lipid A 3-O-deacylase